MTLSSKNNNITVNKYLLIIEYKLKVRQNTESFPGWSMQQGNKTTVSLLAHIYCFSSFYFSHFLKPQLKLYRPQSSKL